MQDQNKTRTVSEAIFADVLEAMQPAEELGGPKLDDYISLMNKIIEEATKRRDAAWYCLTTSKYPA